MERTPLGPKGYWVPTYRKGALADVFAAFYDAFFASRLGANLRGLWLLTGGPMAMTILWPGIVGAFYLLAGAYFPGFWAQIAHHFPWLFWGGLIVGYLFGLGLLFEPGPKDLEFHQEWEFRRWHHLLAATLGFLWAVAWGTGRFELFRGSIPFFLYDVFSDTFYVWGYGGLSLLYLLGVLGWFLGVGYEFREVSRPAVRGGGDSPMEGANQEPQVGQAVLGDLDPTEAAKDPTPTEAETLLWELRRELVLPPEAEREVVELILLLRHHEAYRRRFGQDVPKGVLLVGPPGTGKTSIARFIAQKSRLNFLAATPGELRSKWLGESARLIARLFARARRLAPCVLFVDELDAVAPRRGGHDEVNHFVGQILQELDGIRADTAKAPVVFMGASNHPEGIDPAVLSRIGAILHIPPPGEAERKRILEILLKDEAEGVDLDLLARLTQGFSGRDLKTLVTRASRRAFVLGKKGVSTDDLLTEVRSLRGGG